MAMTMDESSSRYDPFHTYWMELEAGDGIQVRECMECGVLAIDEVKHDKWHEEHTLVVTR